ncbi:MAG: NAD(P)/FAD-dependent oxidoreductase [Actinobacteria bacterium]|nr:NAD(P)/FAD-dependent oxidoreductase [Actinomycetota bacterium]
MAVDFDAIVIGSGLGGLFAGARLAKNGLRVLVLEKADFLGGRFTTIPYKGFRLNTGGSVVALHGHLRQTFDELGIPFPDMSRPDPEVVYRVGGRDVPLPEKGGLRTLLDAVMDDGEERDRLLRAVKRAFSWRLPPKNIAFSDWIRLHTQNREVYNVFRSFAGTMLSANLEEAPAANFLAILRDTRQYPYGLPRFGASSLVDALAGFIAGNGGTIVKRALVTRIAVEDECVKGVVYNVNRAPRELAVGGRFVVSNATPLQTARMVESSAVKGQYLKEVTDTIKPVSAVETVVASSRPLFDAGILCLVGSKRISQIVAVSNGCPEMAPAGRHLYISYNPPASSWGPNDVELETRLVLEDWRDNFKDFDRDCRVLCIKKFSGEYPALRTLPGETLPPATPIQNLYAVGEATGPANSAGSEECALSAAVACRDILSRLGGRGAA